MPNYLRIFPKTAIETSHLVSIAAHRFFVLITSDKKKKKKSVFVVFLSDDATRVILKGTFDYINANYINVSSS